MRISKEVDAVAAIERMHELAMSDNPVKAAEGRLGKEIVALVERWLRAEIDRATSPADLTGILIAVQTGAASLVTSTMFTVFQGAPPPEVIELAVREISAMIRTAPAKHSAMAAKTEVV